MIFQLKNQWLLRHMADSESRTRVGNTEDENGAFIVCKTKKIYVRSVLKIFSHEI